MQKNLLNFHFKKVNMVKCRQISFNSSLTLSTLHVANTTSLRI